MPPIVLATFNARYIHCAFGLRYLLANLGSLRSQTALLEFDLTAHPWDVAQKILQHNPVLLGLGVYIWNLSPSFHLVQLLKRLRPDLIIVLGGPQVSYEQDRQPICDLADYIIAGEADLAFAELARQLLDGQRPSEKILRPPPPALENIELPYAFYSDEDLRHRTVYVEASRGCPFSCEFCLSSLDIPVRYFPLDSFLAAMQQLLDRGLRRFKFVDRTFNLNLPVASAILEFFLRRYQPGLFLHFEIIPDRLPAELRSLIQRFPPGSLQFEVGIQTLDPQVAALISRRQDYQKTQENLLWLRTHTHVHIHSDLIVGLPGETLDSFARGFDTLVHWQPHEIQIELLKRLPGTPISRHDQAWAMLYDPSPPFEVLQTRSIDFLTMQRLRRFARFWDLIGNSGHFSCTLPLILADSPFHCFLALSDWLFQRLGRMHSIALVRLMELVFEYLTTVQHRDPAAVAAALIQDYQRLGRRDLPSFLRPYRQEPDSAAPSSGSSASSTLPARQHPHVR